MGNMKAKSGNRELFGSLLRFPKRDVFDCVPLHYLVLKLSGMGCITPWAGVRNGTTMTTPLDVGLFVGNLALAVSMMLYGTFTTERPANSSIMLIGLKLVNITCYASTIYGLISCFINRHEIWKFYNAVHAIDRALEELGQRTNFNHSFVAFLAYYVFATASCWLLIAVLYRGNLTGMLLLNFGYSYFSLTTFHIVSITCLTVVWLRNVRLNEAFRKQFSLDVSGIETTTLAVHGSAQMQVLRQIMQTFDQICDLADNGSFYYGIQIMVSIAGSFMFLLFYTFAITLVVRSVLPFESVFYAGPLISYAMFAYNILIVAFLGNALKQQGKMTAMLIDRAINSTNNAEIIEMLRLFLMQLGHRSPLITCGLFPFDWTLIFSILSTAATYIIILLQFESTGTAMG